MRSRKGVEDWVRVGDYRATKGYTKDTRSSNDGNLEVLKFWKLLREAVF